MGETNCKVYVNNLTPLKFLALSFEEQIQLKYSNYNTLWHVITVAKFTDTDTITINGNTFMLKWYLNTLSIKDAKDTIRGMRITNKKYFYVREELLKEALLHRLRSNDEYMEAFLATEGKRIVYATPLDVEWGGELNRYGYFLEFLREQLIMERNNRLRVR